MFQIRTNVSSTNNLVFRITASGGVYSDAPYNSAGADYAEYFPSDAHVKIPGGKVVCLDATKENLVKVCDREADPNIIGITSIRPSVVGNAVAGTILNDLGLPVPGYTLVGLIGQLDSTATTMGTGGTIRTGDSLTSSSIPGVLRKALPGESTVGVALTGLSSGQGSIRVLIARSNKSLTVEAVEQRVSQSVANLKVDDQIKTSLEKTLGESSFDQRIASAVSSQVASLLPLQDRVSTIEAQLAELASTLSPSSDGGGKPEGQGGGNLTLTGSLAANTLSAEETLTVGRDARIGGDLFLEGALIMTGDASFSGNVTTGKLTAASGSQIDGTLSIAGDLLIGKNLILGSGSTLTADQLIVANAFFVRGPVTIDGLATFFGNVDIKGELKVSTRQAGYALVKAGESKVIVRFDPPFAATPIVTASPDIPVLFAVSKATATGFTISLKSSEAQDITFSYTALTTDSPRTASGSFAEAPTGTIVFPLDAQGVPVSSSSIWNACIRHQQPLDPVTGQPFSCTRYTPDLYIWTHPDFPNMTFVWNDSYTPPLLVLPENYVRQIVTTSSSSSSDGSGSSVSSSSESSSSSDSSSSDSSSSNSSSSEQSSSSDSSSSDSSSSSSDSSSLDSSSSEGSSSSQ
jgi:cytoskeletal protein CcmA (bactofilin family)